MNPIDTLIQLIRNKFSLEIIRQFSDYEDSILLNSQIGIKLKELINKLNDEYNKLNDENYKTISSNYDTEILLDIKRNIYLNENNQIFDDKLIDLLKDNNNINLINSFNDIINYINSIHYIDTEKDLNNEFLEQYNYYLGMINEKCEEYEEYEEYEYDGAILFFEELKNNFRVKNQKAFEYYDNIQEKYYQILELNFGVKNENIIDNWN
jgi:hypothetical protein